MHFNPRAWSFRITLAFFISTIALAALLLVGYGDWDSARRAWQKVSPLTSRPPLHSTIKALPFHHGLEAQMAHLREIEEWEVPAGMRVVGLVFYGRRRFVEILNCYLERNLVDNGGVVDEYVFIVKTQDEADLAFLETLLQRNPGRYSKRTTDKSGFDYSEMWSVVEPGNVYVKIDDDVLYISDSTIRSIVKRKVEHPEYVMVSANLVVQFSFTYQHLHFGALHPYLPELSAAPPAAIDPASPFPWRPSTLPSWSGPEDFNVTTFEPVPSPAAPRHRWLPLEGLNAMDRTPAADLPFDGRGGPAWKDWRVGAQQHYSFLQNLERNELWRYHFEMWDKRYDRVSINLMAVAGDDILAMMPMPRDDEEMITQLYSKKTGKHVVIDGHGIAVHNAYYVMSERDGHLGIETTDILDRYRAYAQESICMP